MNVFGNSIRCRNILRNVKFAIKRVGKGEPLCWSTIFDRAGSVQLCDLFSSNVFW